MAVIYGGGGTEREVSVSTLRELVINRDERCILAKIGFPDHECRGKWAGQLARKLRDEDWTLEHVTQVHGHLDGRHDAEDHCVAPCHATNIKPPSHEEREAMRDELNRMYPGECRYGRR